MTKLPDQTESVSTPRYGADEDPLVAPDFSGWMGRIIDAVGRSWRPLLLLQLALAVPVGVLLTLFSHAVGSTSFLVVDDGDVGWRADHAGAAVGWAVALVVVALGIGAVVQLASLWVVVHQAAGRASAAGAALRFAVRRMLPLIGWQVVAAVLIVLGAIVILPAIFVAVAVVPTLLGVVGLERGGLRRCFELAGGGFLSLLGRCATALLIVLAYSQLVEVISNGIFGRNATGWAAQAFSTALELPMDMAGMAFLVVTYAGARGRQQPTTTDQLVAALN